MAWFHQGLPPPLKAGGYTKGGPGGNLGEQFGRARRTAELQSGETKTVINQKSEEVAKTERKARPRGRSLPRGGGGN